MDSKEGAHIVDPTIHQILRRAPVEEYSKLAPSPLRVVLVDRHNLNGAGRPGDGDLGSLAAVYGLRGVLYRT